VTGRQRRAVRRRLAGDAATDPSGPGPVRRSGSHVSRFVLPPGRELWPRSNSKITCPNRSGPRPNPLCPLRSTGLAAGPWSPAAAMRSRIENRKALCFFFKNIAEAERLNTVPVGVFLRCLTFENEWAKPHQAICPPVRPHMAARGIQRAAARHGG